jgi:hypothetical protein
MTTPHFASWDRVSRNKFLERFQHHIKRSQYIHYDSQARASQSRSKHVSQDTRMLGRVYMYRSTITMRENIQEIPLREIFPCERESPAGGIPLRRDPLWEKFPCGREPLRERFPCGRDPLWERFPCDLSETTWRTATLRIATLADRNFGGSQPQL